MEWAIVIILFGINIAYIVSTVNKVKESHGPKKMSSEFYYQLLNTSLYICLNNNKNTIMSFYNGETNETIKRLFEEEWPALYQNYAMSSMTANYRPLKPMSSTNAAIIGSAVGGTAVGMAAAIDAEKKQAQYEQNYSRYISNHVSKVRINSDIAWCYRRIEGEISKNENAKFFWENKKREVISKHQREYRLKQ